MSLPKSWFKRKFPAFKKGEVRPTEVVKRLVPSGDLEGDAQSCLSLEEVLS